VAEASIVEDRQIDLVQACRVGDRADLDDLSAPDREVEYHKEPSTRSHDDSDGPVHERRSCGAGSPGSWRSCWWYLFLPASESNRSRPTRRLVQSPNHSRVPSA
jgi:hypothetical protein